MSQSPPRVGTVALVVRAGASPELVEVLSDDREIDELERALLLGERDPIAHVHEFRSRQSHEDEEFGDYVEELVSQPFVKSEIVEHAVAWLKSKVKIERYRSVEVEATQVIAKYAFELYRNEPGRRDFFLAGHHSRVRVRVFELGRASRGKQAA